MTKECPPPPIQCVEAFHNEPKFDRYSTMNKYKNTAIETRFFYSQTITTTAIFTLPFKKISGCKRRNTIP